MANGTPEMNGQLSLFQIESDGNSFATEELRCPHGRPVYLGPCWQCETEAQNHV